MTNIYLNGLKKREDKILKLEMKMGTSVPILHKWKGSWQYDSCYQQTERPRWDR